MYLFVDARTNLKNLFSMFEHFKYVDDSTQMYVYLTPTITSKVIYPWYGRDNLKPQACNPIHVCICNNIFIPGFIYETA